MAKMSMAHLARMLALGPVKALQLLQKRKSQLIDKATNPPMVGPTSLKNQRVSLLPGDVTYIDQITGRWFKACLPGKSKHCRSGG